MCFTLGTYKTPELNLLSAMKWVFLFLGLLLSNLVLAQKYVENHPPGSLGAYYTGYLKDGRYHGQGTYYYDFKNGKHSGEWKIGIKQGKGLVTFFGGTTLSGTWVNGKVNGEVIFHYPLRGGGKLYLWAENGVYRDDYKMVFNNGTVLIGKYPKFKKEGTFTITFTDGNKQQITFKNDQKIGGDGIIKDGFAYYKNYQEGIYTGEWQNEKPNGKGVYTIKNATYEGDWSNGLLEGQGSVTLPNGDSYNGNIVNNKYDGQGIERILSTKSFYEGQFKNGLRHGQGKIITANGFTSSGNFSMGKWHGEITFIDANGKVTSKTYEKGTEVKEIAAEVITKPVVAQVGAKVKESQYPDKLEGEDLLYFLFNEYSDKKVKYWLEKHPDELFVEHKWVFTTPGIEIAYYTGKYGKDDNKRDKPLYDRKAMHVEVSEGFEGKLPGGMEYKAFINAIIQEKYHLLNEYYSRVTPLPYTLSYPTYPTNEDHWDDFVMTLKNGEGSIWVHGIKGFPSSFKVQFRPNSYESTVAKHNSKKKWISDRANKGGDCITCKLENQGKKRVFSVAELEYMAAVRDAKVDLTVYKDHPQLKYLGKSIHDPEVVKLMAKDPDDPDKSLFIKVNRSRYKWEKQLKFELIGRSGKKGYWYVLDEISGAISGVLFIRKEDKFWKWKAHKGNIPFAEKWMEVIKFKGLELFRIAPDKEQSIFQENLSTHKTRLLQQRANQGLLINTLADLERFSKPRGEDIWRITGSHNDELLNKNLFAQNWAFDESYNYGIAEENEYRIEGNPKHILATRRNGYDYIFTGTSADDYEKGYFPLDIRIEFDLNILLPQLFELPEFVSAEYKDRTVKISNREVESTIIQIALNTKHGMRYMIITKYPDQEGGSFSEIKFSSEEGFFGTGTPISLNYNPWKLHNEKLVVVSEEDENKYINAFERLFISMENGYADFPDKSAALEDNDFRAIYLSDVLDIPNTITGFSSLSKYKKSETAWYQLKVTDATKNEYINTLFRKKWKGNYRLTAPEGDEQSTFGKGLIVEKNNQVIGIIQFKMHDTELGNWWMSAHTFNEDAFEKSFEKVVTQANEDDYDSWKGLPSGERGNLSTFNLYNSRLTFISDTLTIENKKETDIRFVFENTPSYVLDFIIRKWQNTATSFSDKVRVKENFRRTYTTTRIVNFNFKTTPFILIFNATHKKLNAINLNHGGNYNEITEELFTPMNLEKATAMSIQAAEAEGYEVVWSKSGDWEFLMQFNERFGSNTGDYMLTVVYEPTSIRSTYPSFGLSGEYKGKNISLRGKREDASSVIDGYMFNAIKFTLGNEKANYRIGGSYGYKDDGLKISVVLFKKK